MCNKRLLTYYIYTVGGNNMWQSLANLYCQNHSVKSIKVYTFFINRINVCNLIVFVQTTPTSTRLSLHCHLCRCRPHTVLSSSSCPSMTCTIFTALHVMQTRYSEKNSVCPSVCPSVRPSDKRVLCDKTVERSVQIDIPYERTFSLVFWEEKWLVGGDPFYLKFWGNRPPLERNRRFSTNNRS